MCSPLSNFAFDFSLRAYNKVTDTGACAVAAACTLLELLSVHGGAVQVDPGLTPDFRS